MEVNEVLPIDHDHHYYNWSYFYRFLISDEFTSRPEVKEKVIMPLWNEPFKFSWNEVERTTVSEQPSIAPKEHHYTMHGIEQKVLEELETEYLNKQFLRGFLFELSRSLVKDKINPAIAQKVTELL